MVVCWEVLNKARTRKIKIRVMSNIIYTEEVDVAPAFILPSHRRQHFFSVFWNKYHTIPLEKWGLSR